VRLSALPGAALPLLGHGGVEMITETTVRAVMWWCGDEHCDCTQPIVERVTPPPLSGHMGYKFERLWEGTFVTSGEEPGERERQWDELREAAARFGVPMPKHAPPPPSSDTEGRP
jgi:trehalose utilization protein